MTCSECLACNCANLTGSILPWQALIDNLPLVARRDFVALKAMCGVSQEDLQDMLAELRNLNPKPGLAFGSEPSLPVVPDVLVRPVTRRQLDR